MRKWLSLGVVACLLVVLLFQSTSTAQTPKTGGMTVINQVIAKDKDNNEVNFPINFTLFKDGVVVRFVELSNSAFLGTYAGRRAGTDKVEWTDIPVGAYELHCESLGYGKYVKRVAIAADTPAQVVIRTMPEKGKEEVQGAGPTLFEMQRKIALLEKENAALKERVAALEKAR